MIARVLALGVLVLAMFTSFSKAAETIRMPDDPLKTCEFRIGKPPAILYNPDGRGLKPGYMIGENRTGYGLMPLIQGQCDSPRDVKVTSGSDHHLLLIATKEGQMSVVPPGSPFYFYKGMGQIVMQAREYAGSWLDAAPIGDAVGAPRIFAGNHSFYRVSNPQIIFADHPTMAFTNQDCH